MKKIIVFLYLTCFSLLSFANCNTSNVSVGELRANAIEAYQKKVCHITTGDLLRYCMSLKYRDKNNCNNFKNKSLRDNCLIDVKLLLEGDGK